MTAAEVPSWSDDRLVNLLVDWRWCSLPVPVRDAIRDELFNRLERPAAPAAPPALTAELVKRVLAAAHERFGAASAVDPDTIAQWIAAELAK